MDFAEAASLIVECQESVNAISDVRDERHRILKVLQLAEDNGVTLTPEILAVELADLRVVLDTVVEEPAEEGTETE